MFSTNMKHNDYLLTIEMFRSFISTTQGTSKRVVNITILILNMGNMRDKEGKQPVQIHNQ